VNANNRRVIGIVQDGVFSDPEIDVWLPMEFDAAAAESHDVHNLVAIGRLKANTSIERALADLKHIALRCSRLPQAYLCSLGLASAWLLPSNYRELKWTNV